MHRFPGLQIYEKCIKKKELCSVKNKIITRRNGDEMEDYSIANTTKEQRIALIRQWIPDEDGLGDSGDMDLWDIYADYINGKREIAEINAEMSGTYYTEEDLKEWRHGFMKWFRSTGIMRTCAEPTSNRMI